MSGENQPNKNLYVILNPIAGNSSAEEIRKALEKTFGEASWNLDIYETTGKENVADLTRTACKDGAGMVIAAGGDGTVSGVVNGLVGTHVPLGILPVGTGNGLARALSIPLDLENALALISTQHDVIELDAMQVGDKHYVLNVSAGISARAMNETPPEQKRRFGMAAYGWTIVRQLFGYQPRRFILTLDDHERRVRANEILISNGAILKEPPFPLGPREKFSDGIFDVYVLTARNLLDYLKVLWNLIFHRGKSNAELHTLTVKKSVKIESLSQPYLTQADGEVIGKTPVEICMVPKAVRVIVPIPKEQEAGAAPA
jgi:YegS/Rv2252/BmrU family lipid kinase